ncbi:hypothetical protein HY994_01595 [Candidatus Micrarchaeota archaeon]|nr:hypothetical protein [Candidatus Micrarchaeota archaeon]
MKLLERQLKELGFTQTTLRGADVIQKVRKMQGLDPNFEPIRMGPKAEERDTLGKQLKQAALRGQLRAHVYEYSTDLTALDKASEGRPYDGFKDRNKELAFEVAQRRVHQDATTKSNVASGVLSIYKEERADENPMATHSFVLSHGTQQRRNPHLQVIVYEAVKPK